VSEPFTRVPFPDDASWRIGVGEVSHLCNPDRLVVTQVHSLDEGVRCCANCKKPIPNGVWLPAIFLPSRPEIPCRNSALLEGLLADVADVACLAIQRGLCVPCGP